MSETEQWQFAPPPHPLVIGVPAFSDNYLWILHAADGDAAVAIDPGDAAPVQEALERNGLRLTAILLTHHHMDHAGGVEALVERWHCPVYGPRDEDIAGITHPVGDGDILDLDEPRIGFRVIGVPGHTSGHIAYYATSHGGDARGLLFCGDTLFAGGCGRIFEGTPAQMLDSLEKLAALPASTLVFCAHEYTVSNLRFAAAAEPDSEAVTRRVAEALRMRALDLPTVPSNIAIERSTNPFLRHDAAGIVATLEARQPGLAGAAPVERLAALREWKNGFR
ncbi:MAG: hydroxyacylglutathione hydrolase [Burkholderiaceae bacterium]|nr:hydroxyacylglutathione hydrolase [Burkholderiaceae bacterium]